MNNALDIKPEELKLVKQILKHCIPGIKVQVFGSRTNNTAKSYSDLDLAVMTEQPLSLHKGAMLTEAFEESDLPFKVDIIDWSTVSEGFKAIIRPALVNLNINEEKIMSKQLLQDTFPELQVSIRQAQELTEQGEVVIAEAIYHELLAKDDNCPPALYGLSQLANKINDQPLRKELLQAAIAQIEGTVESLRQIWQEELDKITD